MIKVKLTKKHFQDVAKSYLAFMKYLREVHGVSAAQQAKNFRLRHDQWGLGESASLLASRQRGYGGGDKSSYGHRYGARPSGRTGQQTRGQRYRQDYDDGEDVAPEYGYAHDHQGYEDDKALIQDDDDGRDFENEPSFDEEDDYDEGYEERPAARGKQPVQNYDEELEDNTYYPDSQQQTGRYRPGPSHPESRERYTARGEGRGTGTGPGQQTSRRGVTLPRNGLYQGGIERHLPPCVQYLLISPTEGIVNRGVISYKR